MSAPRVLVAGIGNVFLGDDGFGVAVAARLAERTWPEGVEVADFGIRGFDLAYALMDGPDAAVLVDALPRGAPPGTLCILEPDPASADEPNGAGTALVDGHALDPVEVLRLVRRLGGSLPPTYVVGCEPAQAGPESGMELSEPVAAAVDDAVELVASLVARLAPPAAASGGG